ncbi:hypothetical protein B0H19DRAFT_1268316 [Mycena capillaripes]|nr:hypothetical protein B0H19DRAFT_1268316 [Mycena capillaripes]
MATPDNLVYIPGNLTGCDADTNLLGLLQELIGSYNDIDSTGGVLLQATFEQIIQGGYFSGNSYTEVLKMLPIITLPIPFGCAEALTTSLNDPGPKIVASAAHVLCYFVVNDAFRQYIFTQLFEQVTTNLLRYPPTANEVLKIVECLGKYDDTRHKIMHSSLGIVQELLKMTKGGANGADRWVVGFKGLRVLGFL